MRVRLARSQEEKLSAALAQAGTNEIGGQLFGEQLARSDFRITELTIQVRRGSFARFIVDLVQAARDAIRFFDRTKHRYSRFNYIGEWHSHPSFDVQPSGPDVETMSQLVCDPSFQGHFAVLMIVRLDGTTVTRGGWLFDPQNVRKPITLETEQ